MIKPFFPFLTTIVLTANAAFAQQLPVPTAQFPELDMAEVKLGQLLFFDPILSGNKSVSCATCHHPKFATSDGVSLGIGDGGVGLGPSRRIDPNNIPEQRIPRNSPSLFNLGATEFTVLFHDGRLEADSSKRNGIRTPFGTEMEIGFRNILSAQTMFPVLSADEMAGHYSENEVAQAVRQGFFTGPDGAWDLLTQRVENIPAYAKAFEGLLGQRDLHFSDISNAIAAFIAFEWRADDSAFDRFLKTGKPLTPEQTKGMDLFYGPAECSTCHSGQFQTDHSFHAIGIPQIGPGKAGRFERHNKDIGRQRVTGNQEDAYKFRTPSLRNVTHTAPYGHSGAYLTLQAVIGHHAQPYNALSKYDPAQAKLPTFPMANDFSISASEGEIQSITSAISMQAQPLTEQEISQIAAFLSSLTDETALKGRLDIPSSVPSGLPIER